MTPQLPDSLPAWLRPRRVTFFVIGVGVWLLGFSVLIQRSDALFSGVVAGLLALLCVSVAACCAFFESLLGLVGWCASLGAILGSIGGACAITAYLVYLFSLRSADPMESIALLGFSSFGLALLGWMPGMLAGMLFGGAFSLVFGGLLVPLQHAASFPAHDDAHQALRRIGGWCLVVGAVSVVLAAGSWLVVPGALFALCGIFAWWVATRTLSLRKVWVQRVQQGQEPRWQFIEEATRPHLWGLPLLSSHQARRGLILLYRQPVSDDPYRRDDQDTPIAIC